MVMFGVIFFRLWFLQVLSGEQYVAEANANRVRDIPIPAPRGEILDRDGQPLVTSRVTNAVQVVPSELPPEGPTRTALYHRLGVLLNISGRRVQELVEKGETAVPYAPVTIKTDAGAGVLTVLGERQSEYPGVQQQPVSIREYPHGELAAHVLGHVDQISEGELKMSAFRGVPAGTVVGQEGLEYYYDSYLRGRPGVQRIEVDAAGDPVPSSLAATAPIAGHSLKVTLDLGLQSESEKPCWKGSKTRALAANQQKAARSSLWTPATAKCSPWAHGRRSTRTNSRNPSRSANTRSWSAAAARQAHLTTGRSTAPTRRARRSSRSPRWRRSKAA